MRRNIYIRDEEEELFAQAEKMAGGKGNLSGVIANALRDWVANRRDAEDGLEIHQIQPGFWPGLVPDRPPLLGRPIKFRGTCLTSVSYANGLVRYELYRTQAGKIVAMREATCQAAPWLFYWANEGSAFCSGEAWLGAADQVSEMEDEWGHTVTVGVFADIDAVTRVDEDSGEIVGGAEDGTVWIPASVWEAAKASLGELDPEWIE